MNWKEILIGVKTCYKCKKEKSFECFSKNTSKSDGLSDQCKECHKKLRREHYLKNRLKILEQVKKQKQEYRDWFRELKNKPCKDCGQSHPHYCMDFDHLTNKEFNIGWAQAHNWSRKRILKEIDKCELICAICHRKRTYKRLNAPLA